MFKLPSTIAEYFLQILSYLAVSFFGISVFCYGIQLEPGVTMAMFAAAIICIAIAMPTLFFKSYVERKKRKLIRVGIKVPARVERVGTYSFMNFALGSPRHPKYLVCTYHYQGKEYRKRSGLIWTSPRIDSISVYAYIDPKTLEGFLSYTEL